MSTTESFYKNSTTSFYHNHWAKRHLFYLFFNKLGEKPIARQHKQENTWNTDFSSLPYPPELSRTAIV